MQVWIEPDYATLSETAATLVLDVVRRKPRAVLGLATGGTPEGLYAALIRRSRAEGVDFSRVTTFNLDEYEGLPAAHPQSYHHYMHEKLFDPLGLRPEQCHLPSGVARDLAEECAAYEAKIRAAGGIDLQILGIGANGHIAFNEPGSSLAGRTRVVALHPKTIADNARYFDRPEDVPRLALTMGVGAILEARACLILASGPGKSAAWANMIEGPLSASAPASALQTHPWTIALCDVAAAANLRERAFYDHQRQALGRLPAWPPALFEARAVAETPSWIFEG